MEHTVITNVITRAAITNILSLVRIREYKIAVHGVVFT